MCDGCCRPGGATASSQHAVSLKVSINSFWVPAKQPILLSSLIKPTLLVAVILGYYTVPGWWESAPGRSNHGGD